ncbi:CMRF35-like molecule 3 [Neoarius graeffei]|uniref:CMRF35-like molecule 3 n=1 Tax=Neoarius graeffei TaxID=443677 RepID=UPI00298C10D6|nr:CMRF35-like molecule 3 [Neoarius graeffei]
MKILLIFTFCLMIADDTDAVTTITGYRGRSVQIQCPYKPGYEEYKKYLCRGECRILGDKDILVESGSPAKEPRFSLYDDTTAKIFTVTITDLRPEDEGTYWCAIEQLSLLDIYTALRLLVKTANPLNDANSPVSTPSDQGIAKYVMISTGAVLFAVGVIIAIYCKRKHQGKTHFQCLSLVNLW